MKILTKLTITTLLIAVPMAAFSTPTPEELGWEAGVVGPSPLKQRYTTPLFKTVDEAEQAKALADEELARVKKLREGQHYLCNQKIFVNSCINKAEKVLKERERFAEQLKRTADHQIRQIEINNHQKKADPEPPQPTRRGEVKTVKEASMPTKRGAVTEPKVTRQAQEAANVEAFTNKQSEQEARKAKLQEEAKARQARREARQARYEADRKKREAAQENQGKEDSSAFPFF